MCAFGAAFSGWNAAQHAAAGDREQRIGDFCVRLPLEALHPLRCREHAVGDDHGDVSCPPLRRRRVCLPLTASDCGIGAGGFPADDSSAMPASGLLVKTAVAAVTTHAIRMAHSPAGPNGPISNTQEVNKMGYSV